MKWLYLFGLLKLHAKPSRDFVYEIFKLLKLNVTFLNFYQYESIV